MEIVGSILSHPDRKNFLRELLNGTNRWLFVTLSQLNGLDPDEIKRYIQQSLENYLQTQKRVRHEYSRKWESYKDFLNDEDITRAAMVYLNKTLSGKFNERPLLALISILISLERKEVEFNRFLGRYPNLGTEKALELFFGEM
jgi:hypothetical protein